MHLDRLRTLEPHGATKPHQNRSQEPNPTALQKRDDMVPKGLTYTPLGAATGGQVSRAT